jgi:hypothetical protein
MVAPAGRGGTALISGEMWVFAAVVGGAGRQTGPPTLSRGNNFSGFVREKVQEGCVRPELSWQSTSWGRGPQGCLFGGGKNLEFEDKLGWAGKRFEVDGELVVLGLELEMVAAKS